MNRSIIQGIAEASELQICTNKVAHMSLRSALDEADRMRRKTGHHNITAYRCDYCFLWHVGHEKTQQRRKADMILRKYAA